MERQPLPATRIVPAVHASSLRGSLVLQSWVP